MGSPKDLNQPPIYAEALLQAAVYDDTLRLAAWLAEDDQVVENPFWRWYAYFAEKLRDIAPRPELGFQGRNRRNIPAPRIGRNDACPCGSGRKFKQCHINSDSGAVAWRLGEPTPAIRSMAISAYVQSMPADQLSQIPLDKCSPSTLTFIASAMYHHQQLGPAIETLGRMLDGDRDDPMLLVDYWVARYAEWLVEAERPEVAEAFLLDEYDTPTNIEQWQVAQKLAAFYLDQGDTDSAETWVTTALEGDPENPFNLYLHGLLLHTVEQWDEAEAAYRRAIETSDRFRSEEKVYMIQLIQESLDRVLQRLPVDVEEDAGGDGEEEADELINDSDENDENSGNTTPGGAA